MEIPFSAAMSDWGEEQRGACLLNCAVKPERRSRSQSGGLSVSARVLFCSLNGVIMRTIFSICLLVLPVVVLCCDETTHYRKDEQCCKLCGPGTRMMKDANCHDPMCQLCMDGEYQDEYTKETKCKLQPICDINLEFEAPTQQSKTTREPCVCRADHHCSSQDCISCVQNTVCPPGQKIDIEGNRKLDTTCEPCPPRTYSSGNSTKDCKEWTECSLGYVEAAAGTSTSDRICEAQPNIRLGLGILSGFVIILVIMFGVFCWYKRERKGSACLEKKLQQHCPALFKVIAIDEPTATVPMQPVEADGNEPTEDTEDQPFTHGVSDNGMPILQDHSKTSVLSVSETQPSSQSFTDRL
uniref:CD40 molecule, TNF receptor superfamily member 5 n=1 Tax=Astyanax mexicanus TaxID=7994 RepID=A0A3B1K1W7_ASTMX